MTSTRAQLGRLLAVALTGITLTACGSDSDAASSSDAETITITDSRGEKEVPLNPDSVLVYDMGVLDTLDALGVEGITGVAKGGAIPSYLEKYESDDYANVGDVFEPDLEAIPATDPDLIIVGGRSSQMHDTLADTFDEATVIDMSVDESAYVESALENARTLAAIFEKEDEVDELVDDYEQRVADVRAKAADAGNALVLLTTAGEVTAYSVNSRFGFLHDDLGLEPATDELGDRESRHGEVVSLEYIRETNPDHLFVVDRDAAIGESGAAAEEILDNEIVAATTAWQQDQVTFVDSEAWYIVVGGLTSMKTILDDVEASLG